LYGALLSLAAKPLAIRSQTSENALDDAPFRQIFALEACYWDSRFCSACSAAMRVTNGIPLGCSLLPVDTMNSVETLKGPIGLRSAPTDHKLCHDTGDVTLKERLGGGPLTQQCRSHVPEQTHRSHTDAATKRIYAKAAGGIRL
jgi:hypothetical protein